MVKQLILQNGLECHITNNYLDPLILLDNMQIIYHDNMKERVATIINALIFCRSGLLEEENAQ